MSHALGDLSAKIWLYGISNILLPMFSSRAFMVSQFIFNSFIQLECILLYGVIRSLVSFFAGTCPDITVPFIEDAIHYSNKKNKVPKNKLNEEGKRPVPKNLHNAEEKLK